MDIFRALKKRNSFSINDFREITSARDWIRTSTSFRTPPPEDGASTNFATRATEKNGAQI